MVAALVCLLVGSAIVLADDGEDFEFTGTIQSLPAMGLVGDWIVGGKTVHVTAKTEIEQDDGVVAVGAVVQVEGTQRTDGSVDASQIEVKNGGQNPEPEIEFKGTIKSLPNTAGFIGDWVVDTRTVHVTSATEIDQEEGKVAVGAVVEVQGGQRADGSVDAKEIQVQEAEQEEVNFKGTIMTLPNTMGFIGDWGVGGKTIHVSSATKIDQEEGPVVVGAFVSIEGTQRADGSIDATKIEVLSNPAGDDGRAELEGTIQSLPNTPGFIGDWKVGTRTVHVTPATVIDQEHGVVAVGAQVEVKGTLGADGSLTATKIEVKGPDQEEPEASMKGMVQSLPHTSDMTGDWVVDSTTVHVTSATRLGNQQGAFFVGGRVKVKGGRRADGSIDAARIKSLN
jgi:hypothetical protein